MNITEHSTSSVWIIYDDSKWQLIMPIGHSMLQQVDDMLLILEQLFCPLGMIKSPKQLFPHIKTRVWPSHVMSCYLKWFFSLGYY